MVLLLQVARQVRLAAAAPVARVCRRHLQTSPPAAAAAASRPLRVFYGSQTGTAQSLGYELILAAESRGLQAELVDLKTFRPELLADRRPLNVFLLAVYGTGQPTDNAKGNYNKQKNENKDKRK